MKMSKLFQKTLVIIILLFGAIAAATSALSEWELHNQLTREYQSKGKAISESIARSSVEILLNRDASTVQAIVDQYVEISGVSYVFVVNAEGEIISHTFVPQIPEDVLKIVKTEEEETEIVHIELREIGKIIDVALSHTGWCDRARSRRNGQGHHKRSYQNCSFQATLSDVCSLFVGCSNSILFWEYDLQTS